MRKPVAFLLGFLATLVFLPMLARAQGERCDASNPDQVRYIAGHFNARTDPRQIVQPNVLRSINEFLRGVADLQEEHAYIWWAVLEDGSGVLVMGSEGGGCGVMQVPATAMQRVLSVTLGERV
jgi:hypothetical protein